MECLRVTATLAGGVVIPEAPIALDALLAWAACARDGVPPATTNAEIVPVEIPVQRSECGRVYLASCARYEVELRDKRYKNKRAPIEEFKHLGDAKIKTVKISAGANKSYRIPREVLFLVDDVITWWCVGDAEAIRSLLALVHFVGKDRSVGNGKVIAWDVTPEASPWPGFPVVAEGEPLRNLPLDWPGIGGEFSGYGVLTPPYWDHSREELCLLPPRI